MFNPLDQTLHPISHEELKRLISHFHITTLTDAQCVEARAALERARSDGKISQYKIHQVLKKMRLEGKINNFDQSATEEVLGEFIS